MEKSVMSIPLLHRILEQFIYFAGGLCFLNAASNLIHPQRKTINIIHAILLTCNGLLFLRLGLYGEDVLVQHPILLFFFTTSLFLIGPLNLIYNHYLLDPGKAIPKILLWQLLPGGIVLLLEIVFQVQPLAARQIVIRDLFTIPLQTPGAVVMILGGLVLNIYHGIMVWEEISLVRSRSSREFSGLHLLALMNIIAFSMILMSLIGFLVSNSTLVKLSGALGCTIYVVDYLSRHRYPAFFQNIQREIKQSRYDRTLKKGLQPQVVFERLEELMRDDLIFMEPDFSLQEVASQLSVRPHQLSQILNQNYQTTFKDYVNSFRVREAQRLLTAKPGETILSICYQVGFNSKSQFNTIFKKIAGMTPQEYRNNIRT